MARRTSDSVRFIEKAKFIVTETKLDRALNFAECLTAYSNEYGLAFVARGAQLLVFSLLKLEPDFTGGEEQPIDESAVICTKDFESSVSMVRLSADSEFLAVVFATEVQIHHISHFRDQTSSAAFTTVQATFEELNFAALWSSTGRLAVLSGKRLQIVDPLSGSRQQWGSADGAGAITALAWSPTGVGGLLLVASGADLAVHDADTWARQFHEKPVDSEDDIKIHHLHWVEQGLVVLGYLTSDSNEPALALARIDLAARRVRVVRDQQDPVCEPEIYGMCGHRYMTSYIPSW
ncbi:hypothetical protein B484DRAFT_251324 [Ochromonadaceae sp. CCMP2298]|nr:hypothetical protein B484DRAFT_251324 [Ochromonadaceae sp. CCMP2298]